MPIITVNGVNLVMYIIWGLIGFGFGYLAGKRARK